MKHNQPLCPYCDTPLVGDRRICTHWLCVLADLEMLRAVKASLEGRTVDAEEHAKKQRDFVERRRACTATR